MKNIKGKGFTQSLLKLQNSKKANYQLMDVRDHLGKTWGQTLVPYCSLDLCLQSLMVSAFLKQKPHDPSIQGLGLWEGHPFWWACSAAGFPGDGATEPCRGDWCVDDGAAKLHSHAACVTQPSCTGNVYPAEEHMVMCYQRHYYIQ